MQVSPKYPDFKQKGSNKGLWLDAAPNWVLLKLDGLVFCGSNSTTKNDKGKSGIFKILVCSLRFLTPFSSRKS